MAEPHAMAPPGSDRCAAPHRRRRQAVGDATRLHRRRQYEAPAVDLASLARERAVRTRRAQGLPDHITDPTTLDQIAQLVLADRRPEQAARSP
jgi:hypothetical protein